MKNLTLSLTLLLSVILLPAQNVFIPDVAFKEALVNSLCVDTNGDGIYDDDADTNNDGEIQLSEALAVERLDLIGQNIYSLFGLNDFSNLTHLDCSGNELLILNINELENLRVVDCSHCRISELDLDGLDNLAELDCSGNELYYLHAQNLPSLVTLNARLNDGLSSIILEELNSLEELNLSGTNLTSLDIPQSLPSLRSLNYSGNALTSFEIQDFPNLEELLLTANDISTLSLQNVPKLKSLSVSYNELSELNLDGLSALTSLDISYNYLLTSLELQNLDSLQSLNASGMALGSLELQGFPVLETIICSYNEQITTLVLRDLPALTTVDSRFNAMMTELEMENLPALSSLSVSDCQLTAVNTDESPLLFILRAENNEILSFLPHAHLGRLYCNGNDLTAINTAAFPNLRELYCEDNLLFELDLHENEQLEVINFSGNPINEINLKNGSNENGVYFSGTPNLTYICCDEGDLIYLEDQLFEYGYINVSVNSYCTLTPGGNYTVLQGQSIYDATGDGCDDNDVAFPYLKYNIDNGTSSGTLVTGSTGEFSFNLSEGVYTIAPAWENPAYFNISPESLDFTASGQDPQTQDFCISASEPIHDVDVTLIPLEAARPGFDASYRLVFKNKGNQIENGSLELTFNDDLLYWLYASIPPDEVEEGLLRWEYTDLFLFESREIILNFNLNSPMENPPVNIGDILYYHCSISGSGPDETERDNSFTLAQTVVGSYDPNDKTCLEGDVIQPEMVGNYVHYLIRFENTGTYPAENVVVRDVIDTAVFDIASFQLVDASHELSVRISNGNVVEFIFANINLPFEDEFNDGFVVFKIKTLPSLGQGDQLTNTADIYFDFNFPIITNTTATLVDNDLDDDGFLFTDDCDDNNAAINPDALEEPYNGVDEDCDPTTLDDDLDEDGFIFADDCDDTNAAINPDAEEIPDNDIDENCDEILVAVAEPGYAGFKVYPVPVSQLLTIELEERITDVKMFSIDGQLIFIGKIAGNQLDVATLVPGVYLLEVRTAWGVYRRKVLKIY